jgi:DNA polymerase-3 subunit alpha
MYLSAHPLDVYRFECQFFANCTVSHLQEVKNEMPEQEQLVRDGKLKLDKSVLNKQYTIAGIVTSVEQKTTRNNKPFCRFAIEDYTGSFEFSLFAKDYEKFMQYTVVNTPLLIKCVTEQRYDRPSGGDGERTPVYSLRIADISLLANTKEERVKEFHVKIPTSRLDPEFQQKFAKVCKKCRGKARLYVKLYDDHNRLECEFFSRKFLVWPEQPLLDFLEENGIEYYI